jgi:flavin reductase (DIM6/NTAB) family NADH-FMN oxidoreductase RutF
MTLSFNTLEANERYKLMSYSLFPRPIAWIVTENEGIINVAPFSYFAPLSSKPAVVVVSIGKKADGSPKDTLANILATKKATICIPHPSQADVVSKSATSLPREESECEAFGIPTTRTIEAYPPIITGVHAAFFASFRELHPIDESPTTPVFLTLEHAYYDDSVIDETQHVTMEALGRVGKYFLLEGKRIEA